MINCPHCFSKNEETATQCANCAAALAAPAKRPRPWTVEALCFQHIGQHLATTALLGWMFYPLVLEALEYPAGRAMLGGFAIGSSCAAAVFLFVLWRFWCGGRVARLVLLALALLGAPGLIFLAVMKGPLVTAVGALCWGVYIWMMCAPATRFYCAPRDNPVVDLEAARNRPLAVVTATVLVLVGLANGYLSADHNPYLLPGVIAEQMKDLPRAERHYRNAVAFWPDRAKPHWLLGATLVRQGKNDEAEKETRESIRLDPSLETAHFNLGVILIAKGRATEARAALERAFQLDPTQARTLFQLARAAEGQGKIAEAISYNENALQKAPDERSYQKNLERLEKLR